MRHIESNTQQAFIRWFRAQYPAYWRLCFAVANGGARNPREGATLKREGVVAGVADVLITVPRCGYGSLALEFKTLKGRQSAAQKAWQADFEHAGNKYVVVRTLEVAIIVTKNYLQLTENQTN